MLSIFDIHNKLGLNLENGLFIKKSESSGTSFILQDLYEGDFTAYKSNYKVEYALKKLKPQSFFLFNNEPLLLFFDYAEDINDIINKKLSTDVWNFNKSALIFVNTPTELNIYNGFDYDSSGLLKLLDVIRTVSDFSKLNNYSYWKIVTSELWNLKDDEFRKKNRVDVKLLENIKAARELLIDKSKNSKPLSERHANRIIGRLIFVRYLIDRKVNLDYNGDGKELLTKDDLPQLILQKKNLYDFFEYLLMRFKGDVLPLNGEYEAITDLHLLTLSQLFAGHDIASNQRSFFNLFDFDFIPIELISNIYETFLSETQDNDKAFYTPPFLVDYVLEQTVKPFISKQNNSKKLSCKTVDFTCGSGIFLCETLRTIINRYIELEKPDKSAIHFKNKINELVKENIFGNDTNQEAIEIAKFSLFITLLDYFENPKDIDGFEFPNISDNFFHYDVFNDSLDKIFGNGKLIELDFILGNPPWGKVDKSRYLDYIKDREDEETKERREDWLKGDKKETFKPISLGIGNKEFAQAYLLRLSDFSSFNTECQIIVTSKLLYNLQASGFRNYLLKKFEIKEVLEISSVRHQIFANAVGPAAIIKYKFAFGQDTSKNVIDYISLKPSPFFAIFKSILIEKHDYKEIIQRELIENDWLWKVLVYGHILDYKFINKLRNRKLFPITLGELLSDKNDSKPLFISTGVIIGNKSNDCTHYKGMYFIETDSSKSNRPSDLKRYYTHLDKHSKWLADRAERVRNEDVFKKPPTLLVKKGLTSDFRIIASISYISCVFAQSIYGIKSKVGETSILENILGLINSDLMNYYLLLNGSSTGIEREQLINKELYPFPIIINNNLSLISKKLIKIKRLIEILKRSNNIGLNIIHYYEMLFCETEKELNDHITSVYNLSEREKSLILFALEITIPVLTSKNKSFKEVLVDKRFYRPFRSVNQSEIIDYIKIFKEHFSNLLISEEKRFLNARIIFSEHVIAIEFILSAIQLEDEWVKDNDDILDLIATLGIQKVSNDLFIQKDIKTLKKDSFSVVKLNQYKLWHKAIAYLDVVEFSEAMIKSQIQV